MKSALFVVIFFIFIPSMTAAATYYVATDGNDRNSCAETTSLSKPKRTINAGLTCLMKGDTLVIGPGTYAESIAPNAIPSGLGPDARTTLRAAHGEVVTIKPNTGNWIGDAVSIYDRSYITLDGINIDGTNVASMTLRIGGSKTYAHYITVQNATIRSGHTKIKPQTCINQQGPAGANSNLQFINLEVTDCGPADSSGSGHGIYLTASNSLIERCRVHHAAKVGIHAYASDRKQVNNNIIRNNVVASNGSVGILLGSGNNNLVENNIVRGNGYLTQGGGVSLGYGVTNSRIFSNKIYNNRGYCIRIRANAINSVVKNNVCEANSTNGISNQAQSGVVSDNVFTSKPAELPQPAE